MRLYLSEESGRGSTAVLRWAVAGLLVAGVHLVAGWWLVSHSVLSAPLPEEAKGIPLDLEPIAVPQNASEPASTTAAGPAAVPQAAAAPEPTSSPVPPEPSAAAEASYQPAPPSPGSEAPASEAPRQTTEDTPPPEMTPPGPVQPPPEREQAPPPIQSAPQPLPPQIEPKSDAVMSVPPPRPSRPKSPPRPDPRVVAREAAKRKVLDEKRERERQLRRDAQAAARAEAQARAAQVRTAGGATAPGMAPSAASSGADVASWRGAVVAHLNGFKPSTNGAEGTARVSFAVDRGGRVVSASLAGSSGDPQLDAAAISMVRRASPMPAPPPELGNRINLTVPVRFHQLDLPPLNCNDASMSQTPVVSRFVFGCGAWQMWRRWRKPGKRGAYKRRDVVA